MKRTLKKAMSILLAFTLIFGSFAFGFSDVDWSGLAVKAEAHTVGGFTFTADGKDLLSVDKSLSGDVVVPEYGYDPESVAKLPVEIIREDAFKNCTGIKSVKLPDSVICIYEGAFSGCTSLESITLSSNLVKIGYEAFKSCTSLKSIVIPDKVKIIGADAFYGCENLTSVTLPDSLTEIYSNVFYGCKKLDNIIIPDSVTKIGNFAFEGCKNLTSVTIPDSVTNIGTYAFEYCTSLTSVTIGNNVTTIGYGAFARCTSLTSVTIPDSVTSIGTYAFSDCDELENITVEKENTVYSSDEYGVLFNKDKTKLIKYPEGNTSESYIIPDGVTSVDEGALKSCNFLESIIFPDSIAEINSHVIGGCVNLEFVHIPESVIALGEYNYLNNDAYICSTTQNCYAKDFADANEIEFRVCNGHNTFIPEPTTKPVVTEPATTKPVIVPVETTTIPVTEPSTTKPVEVPITTKPVVTEPSTTKPVEVPTTTKPVEIPATTKPTETTKPVETPVTTKPTETTKPAVVTNPVETTKPEPTTKPSAGFIFKILEPSVSTVKYGETLILHTNLTSISADAKIEWSVEGEGVTIAPSADGLTCAVTSTATGDVTVTAKYVDANGVEHVSEQEIESNASFWNKIVSFFKNLFGMNRVIEQRIKF